MKKYAFYLSATVVLALAFVSCGSGGNNGGGSQTISITGVSLNKTEMALKVDAQETLAATVRPSDATNKTLTWTSSNTNVAAVSNSGVVTAISAGEATITVTTQDGGKTAGCFLTVLPPGPDVYVAGFEWQFRSEAAPLWKNGMRQNLNSGYWGEAKSVFVSGEDVYVAGYDSNAVRTVAMLWKNGEAQPPLSNGNFTGCANSVFVSDGDVYVAGYERNELGRFVAKLWKNGIVSQTLNNGNYNAWATSVFVSGGDVYVAGYENDYATLFEPDEAVASVVAKLWKNGILYQTFNNGNYNAFANSVYVSGNDVYVAGYEHNERGTSAMLWKNGVGQELSVENYAQAYSVFVSGDDVYVAGYEIDSQTAKRSAMLWKNGVGQALNEVTDPAIPRYRAEARSVFVSGDDVYVTGYQQSGMFGERDAATLWKNGVAQRLDESHPFTGGHSVFVK